MRSFQDAVKNWLISCFGINIAFDKPERSHRFMEESLELAQACGCTADDCHKLVDYVFNRPIGDKTVEAGDVLLTLSSLCLTHNIDLEDVGQSALERVWANIDKIRKKRAAKTGNSSLPH